MTHNQLDYMRDEFVIDYANALSAEIRRRGELTWLEELFNVATLNLEQRGIVVSDHVVIP